MKEIISKKNKERERDSMCMINFSIMSSTYFLLPFWVVNKKYPAIAKHLMFTTPKGSKSNVRFTYHLLPQAIKNKLFILTNNNYLFRVVNNKFGVVNDKS